MLGLGSNMMKHPVTGKSIVRDGLVLQHNYNFSSVEPLSDGAAAINADANGTDHIDVGVIEATTNDVTVSAWVYITDWINYAAIFQNRHGSSPNQGFAIRTMSAKTFDLITDKGSASTSSTSSAKNNNQWYHVCAVIDRSGNQYLYVDGVLEDSDDISGYSADSLSHTTTARIGKNYSSNEINGYVCNVGYWNAALSQAQVKSIMNKNYDSLSASEKTNLVSWWNLDSTIPGLATAVYDNHHGGGEILGADELICGDFSCSDPTDNWTTISGSAEYSNDSLVLLPSGKIRQNSVTSAGNYYTVAYEVTENLGAKLQYYSGSGDYVTIPSTVGTHSFDFLRLGSDNNFYLKVWDASSSLTISSISVKLINGNTGTLS